MDSVVAKALKFLGWSPNAAGTDVEVPRHEIAGALIIQAEAPLAADLSTLDAMSVLEYDVGEAHGSAFAHVLDKAGAFNKEYATFDSWAAARKAILATVPDVDLPALKLSPTWFDVQLPFHVPGRAATSRRAAVPAVTDPAEIRFLTCQSLHPLHRFHHLPPCVVIGR